MRLVPIYPFLIQILTLGGMIPLMLLHFIVKKVHRSSQTFGIFRIIIAYGLDIGLSHAVYVAFVAASAIGLHISLFVFPFSSLWCILFLAFYGWLALCGILVKAVAKDNGRTERIKGWANFTFGLLMLYGMGIRIRRRIN